MQKKHPRQGWWESYEDDVFFVAMFMGILALAFLLVQNVWPLW